MRLFIAEKPDLARAIAAGLSSDQKRENNCIRCGNDVVTWCVGHIMTPMDPDEYDIALKKWSLESLPIIPDAWKLRITKQAVFNGIKSLMATATEIVNAGDPDREGQLLVDEVIYAIGTKAPVKRLLVSDLNLPAVKKSLANIKDNGQFKSLYDSALARQRADWLFGMNLTRLYTIQGQEGGYDGVLSVGRVQTPLLGLIVKRDREIENFVSKPFYEIVATIKVSKGSFTAKWQPADKDAIYLDDEKRLINKDYAEGISDKVLNQLGMILSLENETKKVQPQKPFSLSTLQIAAAKRYNFDPDKTLQITQSLYEKHKLVTYPRSDCEYLPEGHFSNVPQTFDAIGNNGDFESLTRSADTSIKSSVWNDKKVSAHHAIIPTTRHYDCSTLSKPEADIYELIVERYVMQFYKPFVYNQTTVVVNIQEEFFKAIGKTVVDLGWKAIFSDSADAEGDANDQDDSQSLPEIILHEPATLLDPAVSGKKTTPPKHFTSATLVSAMTGIGRYVEDKNVKKLLNENDGIGTPATQANIIKTLFDRSYVAKKGKNIISTEVGRSFIEALPRIATTPDMTAYWELAMKGIVSGEKRLEGFLEGVQKKISELVQDGIESGPLTLNHTEHECPSCQSPLRKRSGQNGAFWGCRAYPECKTTVPDKGGKPDYKVLETHPCPDCGKDMKRRKGSNGHFWGCTGFPECKTTLQDKRGKPQAQSAKPQTESTEHDCKACGKSLVRRVSIKGRGKEKRETPWYGCSGFPVCKQTYFEVNGQPKY